MLKAWIGLAQFTLSTHSFLYFQSFLKSREGLIAEQHKRYLSQAGGFLDVLDDGAQGNRGGFVERVAIDASAKLGKSDT